MDIRLSHYVKVVDYFFDSFSEEEIEAYWDKWKLLYLEHRKRREEERGEQ